MPCAAANFVPFAAANFGKISELKATGFRFCISFIERMECDDKKGYVYCTHCNDFVSCLTFQRHERKCNKSNLTDTFGATSNSHDLFHEISSSSDNEG